MLIELKNPKVEKTFSRKISIKASAAKILVKPPPGDKTLGFEPEICFYEIEGGDNTEKGEKQTILIIHD